MTRLFMRIRARVLDMRPGAHQSRRTYVYRHACGVRENGLVHAQLRIQCHTMYTYVRRACEDGSVHDNAYVYVRVGVRSRVLSVYLHVRVACA